MKKSFLIFTLCLFVFAGTIYSQPVNDDNLKSRVFLPPGYDTSPFEGFELMTTVDGFDNFYLGVDFGEPHIATNPRDPLNSVTAYNINNYYYTLNGYQWIKTAVTFPGFPPIGDPVLTFDSIGNVYYLQMYQIGSNYGLVVAKSTNKGVSFSQFTSVYNFPGLSDKPWICADQTAGPFSNNLYVGWRQFGSTGMRFSRSTNGGLTWTEPLFFQGSQGAYVAVGPDGNTQGGSVYFANVSGGGAIFIARSTDGGATFGQQINAMNMIPGGIVCAGRQTVKNCIRTNNFPRVAVDNSWGPYRGTVYIVTEVNPPDPLDISDIYLTKSTDNGVTWSTPVRVNDDATTTDQWMPAISVDNNNGHIFINWYDSRMDPVNNIMTKLYGTVSTNGGSTFTTNEPISTVEFNPNNMAVSQGAGQAFYIGDYIGISAIGTTSYSSWMDGRNNNLGSYTAFYPDFAMTLSENRLNLSSSSSAGVNVIVPATKGPFSDRVKFTASLEDPPSNGTITFSFQNGLDSLINFPDSVRLNVNTSAGVTPGRYIVNVIGRGRNGTPVHKRDIEILVDASVVNIATNRGNLVPFNVNGASYSSPQEFVFANGTNVSVEIPSMVTSASNRYKFTQWSNGSTDTLLNFSVSGNLDLVANYKRQYLLLMNSTIGNTFGGNEFYDSASQATFGVLSRIVSGNGLYSEFRGWTGGGPGSYTSPDSSGTDTVVTVTINNPIVQTARWYTIVGITQTGEEMPERYELYQNHPNPFNPVTNIRFDIVKTGNVKISVFDITGREVEILVNEIVQPGKYTVSFDASSFATGIYYYRIQTGDFVSVKKMLLIK